ncbi:hypothetical protein M8J77_002915 [Diaphorina citri]|nr:hypothetical protein M8J77_002915 [Diaphorina citri]
MMGLSITTRLGGQFEKKVLNSGSEEEGSLGTKVLSCSKVVESISRPVDMDTFYKHYRPVYQIFHIKIQQQHL